MFAAIMVGLVAAGVLNWAVFISDVFGQRVDPEQLKRLEELAREQQRLERLTNG